MKKDECKSSSIISKSFVKQQKLSLNFEFKSHRDNKSGILFSQLAMCLTLTSKFFTAAMKQISRKQD
jgi:hypothetical protein